MIRRSTGTMLFFMAGMTLEFAVDTMPQKCLWLLGYPEQALRRSQDSMSLARELSHPSTMAIALYFIAWFHQHRGESQAVQAAS